jgi:uridine kinase
MARWAPERKDTVTAIADEILHHYGRGRVMVAVDGRDGAGKSHFADDLAATLRSKGHVVFRASLDDFHKPRVERYRRGRDSAEGFYHDSYDYSVFRRVLVGPFRMGGSAGFVTAAFDTGRDAAIEPKWITAQDDAILIVDGLFLNRPELHGLWNYSLWVEAPEEITRARVVARDGADAAGDRYTGGEALYLAEANPRTAAVAIIDNTDFDHPRRIFADSC